MSRPTDPVQDPFFQQAVDPSYLLNMPFDNNADMSYAREFQDFPHLNNSDITNTLFANTSTGFTPSTFASNGPSPFFNTSLQGQSYLGTFEDQHNDVFPGNDIPPQYVTDMSGVESVCSSQQMDDEQSISSTLTASIPHNASRSKQTKTETSPAEMSPAPPVRKRRARKNKKQLSEEEVKAKRERFLERNRIAASKCRDKKKDWTNKMEEKMRILQADRSLLKELAQTLMEEKRTLTALLHEHSGCNHKGLDAWLREKATAILSSPDTVMTSQLLSRTNSSQSSQSSPIESNDSTENRSPFDQGRSDSLDSKMTNITSPCQSFKEFATAAGISMSPDNMDRNGTGNTVLPEHGTFSDQSGSYLLSSDGYEHQKYYEGLGRQQNRDLAAAIPC